MNQDIYRAFNDYAVCNVADAMVALNLLPCFVDGLDMLSPDTPKNTNTRISGPAHTVQFLSSEVKSEAGYKKPYVDSCTSGCIVVLSCPSNVVNANMGGLIMQRAKQLGVVGAVVDGRVRDLDEIRSEEFPVFAKGTSVHGAKPFTVTESVGQPITLSNNVQCKEGDVVVADINGVVIVPLEHAERVLNKTKELSTMDENCMEELKKGTSFEEANKKHRTK